MIKEFKAPDGVTMSENEQKLMNGMAEWFRESFTEFAKSQKSGEDYAKEITEKLSAVGFSPESLQKINESLKAQGEMLTSLKEKANKKPNLSGLKAAFYEQFDEFAKALKEKKEGFEIKAVDEHDPDLIHTTNNIITTTSGAFLPESVGNDPNLHLRRRDREYIHDIATVSVVDQVPETFNFTEEGDEQGYIAVVAENGLKPQVKLKLIKNQVNAQKAAGYITVTEEVMKWRPRAWAQIRRLFNDKVYRDYEDILTTNLLNNASSYISTPLDGTIASPNDFDALIASIVQMEQLNFQPNVLVINPSDKWRLAMTTTANGMFVLPYIQNGGQFALLGLRVITTNKIDPGQFLIGESNTWFIEEERPKLRIGLINDDLVHNRTTIIGEIFFLHYVPSNNAGSFILGNFADIKEALTSADAGLAA